MRNKKKRRVELRRREGGREINKIIFSFVKLPDRCSVIRQFEIVKTQFE